MDKHPQNTCNLHLVESDTYLLTNGPDLISQHLRQGNVWEQETLNIACDLIKDVDAPVLVDIGANLGAWSVPMGRYIREKGGVIHSFEPQRQVFYQLCANFFVNNLPHCYANNMAIGDYVGTINVPVLDPYQSPNLGALSLNTDIRQEQGWIKETNKTEQVTIMTLDRLNLLRADLIKIDVEGLELEVLSGALRWLKKNHYPPVIFEVWGDYMASLIPKRQKLLALMEETLGYEVTLIGELCIARHPLRT